MEKDCRSETVQVVKPRETLNRADGLTFNYFYNVCTCTLGLALSLPSFLMADIDTKHLVMPVCHCICNRALLEH